VLKRHGAKVAVLSEPDAGQVKVLIQKSTDEATTPSRAELEFVDQFVLPRLMDIIGREPDPEKTKQSWESGPKDSEDPATSKTDFKGKRINERMLDILLKKRESLWWTAENWRIALNCSKGTVGETYAWKVVIHGRREQEGKEREKRQQRNEGHQEDD